MKCPKCNAWTFVLESRAKDDATRRRYECANGHRITTEERPVRVDNGPVEKGDRRATPRPRRAAVKGTPRAA